VVLSGEQGLHIPGLAVAVPGHSGVCRPHIDVGIVKIPEPLSRPSQKLLLLDYLSGHKHIATSGAMRPCL